MSDRPLKFNAKWPVLRVLAIDESDASLPGVKTVHYRQFLCGQSKIKDIDVGFDARFRHRLRNGHCA